MFLFLTEFWLFVRQNKKFWLIPLLIMLSLLVLFVALNEGSAVAPFVYMLF